MSNMRKDILKKSLKYILIKSGLYNESVTQIIHKINQSRST